MCSCWCCGTGDRILRVIFWGVWLLFCFPLRVIEYIVIGAPFQYVLWLIVQDWHSMFAGSMLGTGFAQVIFVPLIRNSTASTEGFICATYVGVICWMLGHIIVGTLVYLGIVQRWNVAEQFRCFSGTRFPLVTMSTGGYLGFLLGFLVAFPLIVIKADNDYAPFSVHWCRPSSAVTGPVVCILAGLLGALTSQAGIRTLSGESMDVQFEQPRIQAATTVKNRSVYSAALDEDDEVLEFSASASRVRSDRAQTPAGDSLP